LFVVGDPRVPVIAQDLPSEQSGDIRTGAGRGLSAQVAVEKDVKNWRLRDCVVKVNKDCRNIERSKV